MRHFFRKTRYKIISHNDKGRDQMKCTAENIECALKDGILRVKLRGEIDHHSAKYMRKKIDSELFITRPNEMYLDLSGIEFMDSSGLGLILGRYPTATEMGIGFTLYDPSPSVLKIIKLSGCERIINVITRKQV